MLISEEIILLNNLMYMNADSQNDKVWPLCDPQKFEGQSIGEWINKVDFDGLIDDEMYDGFMTGSEWKSVISAVKSNEKLMNMTIKTTHVDNSPGGGEGFSALFVDERGSEAVIAFRGTQGGAEWYDNFIGGNVSETPCQRNALDWYQDIYNKYNLENYETVTVSGHSKGGNKGKFITIMDDTVDRCFSIDGQGFSDKFYLENSYKIAKNQSKIQNYNIDYDPVNLLLNDIGEKTYYEGQDIGGYMENHAPNSFFKFDDSGNYEMIVNQSGQSSEMKEMDEFLNGFLRSLDDSDRTQTLDMIGKVVRVLKNERFVPNAQNIINLFHQNLLNSECRDNVAYLLAYTIRYEQAHPEFSDSIKSVLNHFGMKKVSGFFELACNILNVDKNFLGYRITFDNLYNLLYHNAQMYPEFVADVVIYDICLGAEALGGVKISPQELKDLFSMLGMVKQDLKTVQLNENGKDIWVGSLPPGVLTDTFVTCNSGSDNYVPAGDCDFWCDLPRMRAEAENIISYAAELQECVEEIRSVACAVSLSDASNENIKNSLRGLSDELSDNTDTLKQMGILLKTIADMYEKTESVVVDSASRLLCIGNRNGAV